MTDPIQGRTPAAWMHCVGRLCLAALPALLVLHWAAGAARAQQPNFQPLERGDFTQVEERIVIAKGLEVGADYAFRMRVNRQKDLPPDQKDMDQSHDLRLRLDTVFNTDLHVHLTLELANQDFSSTQIREAPPDSRGRLTDGMPTVLNAREAYLRYNFNPRSGVIMGKQELSLGDRRGKTFDALVPGITFDCRAGTWCVPFGIANIGANNADAVTHLALQYTAWDMVEGGTRRVMQVEVFRIRYKEANVPLGRNLGPARLNPEDPTGQSYVKDPTNTAARPDPTQLLDATAKLPVYYDAHAQDYFGLRLNWQGALLFVNFDVVSMRGERIYHLYDSPNKGVPGQIDVGGAGLTLRSVSGTTIETELGATWATGRAGLRYMTATGDDYRPYSNGQSYNRGLKGYFEITPGSYTGTRLYFNGANTSVDLGGGLGHSINNTRLLGLFLDYAEPDKHTAGYQGGLYQLTLNRAIADFDGRLQRSIGVEWDNMMTLYIHKGVRLELEANVLLPGGAFRVSDTSVPNPQKNQFLQFIGRFVYSF